MKPNYEAIAQMERELKIGPHAHPYGFDIEGLVDEVRVEHEAWFRANDPLGMPSLVKRIATARAEAARRWPYMFVAAGRLKT